MTLNKVPFLFFVSLFCLNLSFGQSNPEDLYNTKKAAFFTTSNNDSLLYYSKKMRSSKDSCTVSLGINLQAKAIYQKGNFVVAKNISQELINQLQNKNSLCLIRNKITALNRLFWIYKNENKLKKAFEVLLLRKETVEELPIKDDYYYANKISTENNLAIIKSSLGLHKESRGILKKMLPEFPEVYKNLNSSDYFLKLNQTSTLNSIGESYLKSSKDSLSKDLDSASIYFKKAYEIAKKIQPSS